MIDFRFGETTDKDQITVPGGLEDFTWGKFRDIEFLVSITNVTITGDHLLVDNSQDSLDTENI